MKALTFAVIFLLFVALGFSIFYMNNYFFPTSGAAVRTTEAQLRDGCNLFRNTHKCDIGVIYTISFAYVNSDGTTTSYKLFDLCQARGIKTANECAMVCGCY
jgi:hypothetical protein